MVSDAWVVTNWQTRGSEHVTASTELAATTRRWSMYDFAIVALLALATLKLVDFLTDAIPQLRSLRSLMTFVIAIGATLLLDYSVFKGWGIGIRNDTVGTWVTGFVVAGLTVPWRALFAYLTHDRARADETPGDQTPSVSSAHARSCVRYANSARQGTVKP